jgi:hypothetical protein
MEFQHGEVGQGEKRRGIPRTRRTAFVSGRGRHVLGPHATVTWSPTRHHAANRTTGQQKIGDLYMIPLMGVGMDITLRGQN